jgi:hypothetical protein
MWGERVKYYTDYLNKSFHRPSDYWTDEDYAWFFDRARERQAQGEGK